jgi:apolipoprotein N-acyltransferase
MPLIYILLSLAVVIGVAWLTRTYTLVPPSCRNIVHVVLGLIVVGMLLWLVNAYIPMAVSIKGLLNIVVVIACCVWVLNGCSRRSDSGLNWSYGRAISRIAGLRQQGFSGCF